MKKIILFAFLLAITAVCFSQRNEVPPYKVDETLLKKSKSQKTTAWILVGGGAALVLTGSLIPQGEFISSGNWWNDVWGAGHYENENTRSAFTGIGTLSMLGSIPLFLASSKNKKRAMSLSFDNKSIPLLQKGSWVKQSIPSVSLKIYL